MFRLKLQQSKVRVVRPFERTCAIPGGCHVQVEVASIQGESCAPPNECACAVPGGWRHVQRACAVPGGWRHVQAEFKLHQSKVVQASKSFKPLMVEVALKVRSFKVDALVQWTWQWLAFGLIPLDAFS
eukprot:531377-Pelagomonas_calceolata.AAC.1